MRQKCTYIHDCLKKEKLNRYFKTTLILNTTAQLYVWQQHHEQKEINH